MALPDSDFSLDSRRPLIASSASATGRPMDQAGRAGSL
jgi:hypothetical protein